MKLLLVEDNLHLADDMSNFLISNGFVVEHAATLCEGSEKIGIYHYDMVIVDIGLPDGNGFSLIERLKASDSDAAVLIVTAKNAIEDKVHGLDLGADDYITKPFHKSELNARIRSILRRKKFSSSNILKMNAIRIALIGVIFTLLVTKTPISVVVLIGLIMLAGITHTDGDHGHRRAVNRYTFNLSGDPDRL
jgi:DNA-binding response OmpR family regulator